MRVPQLLVIFSLVSVCSSTTPSTAQKRRIYHVTSITSEIYKNHILPLLPPSLQKKIDRVVPPILEEIGRAVFDQLEWETILTGPFDATIMGKLFEVVFLQMQEPRWEKMWRSKYRISKKSNILQKLIQT